MFRISHTCAAPYDDDDNDDDDLPLGDAKTQCTGVVLCCVALCYEMHHTDQEHDCGREKQKIKRPKFCQVVHTVSSSNNIMKKYYSATLT